MKASMGLHMLFAIWLALLACIADGDTSSMSNLGYSMNSSSPSSHQISSPLKNITDLYIGNLSSMGNISMASSTGYLKQTVTTIAIASHTHLQGEAQIDLSIQVSSGHFNPTQTTSFDLSLGGKLSCTSLWMARTSMTTGVGSSRSESPTDGDLTGHAQKIRPLMPEPSQTPTIPVAAGDRSDSIEFPVLSTPTLIREPAVPTSSTASTMLGSAKPRAEASTPAPATHNALVIGVVVGVTCGLLVAVLVAAACCSSRVRKRVWFWRRPQSNVPARDGHPRCDSAATTLTATSAGISNASSDTVFEAYGVRPDQTSNTAAGRSRLAPVGTRTYDSYEMDNLRAGYAAGGYLSAV